MAAGPTVIEAVKEFAKENGSFHMKNQGKSDVNGKARGKADLAYGFFSKEQGSSSSSCSVAVDGEERGSEYSLESLFVNVSDRSKNRSASVGTVSSIIGKDYLKTTQSKQGYGNTNKSMKLNSKVLPVSEPLVKEVKLNSGKDDRVHNEMEEFLFHMLGDGFQLDRDVIRQVLDACGYDMPKSMEKLLDMSMVALDKKSESLSGSTDKYTGLHSKAEFPSHQRECTRYSRGTEDTASNSSEDLSAVEKQKNNLERDILTSLFCASDAKNDSVLPKVRVKAAAKSRGIFGDAVKEPLRDSVVEQNITEVHPKKQDEYDQDEERFQALRQGVKENNEMMKHYYKSAVEAWTKGDHVLFEKLKEQGQFYHEKAFEAYEESSQMILETNVEAEDDMLQDLSDYDAKGAIRLLKDLLSSLSGISSIQYLKLIIDANGKEDSSKGLRRRRVLKLLEKESIEWVEGESAGTIRIRLDSINPKRLSFVKK
ncbi:putative nuclear RNA export factor SDE5 [Humulus lupulus]|uniref:putative nuclear RNA export factor SDE5 n=1 Tax=Humulus lupulus TaxID=3486 RepID=UPI002B408383|nr:putative nuclear RNA export factor SDE5 [Humulus lupulus]XP_062096698.1 putative nuclear RNA export factor SDE5 [Humulus lupulus]XP_062096699.1 putative nuclear RNA export factor SDE5 [Humulus lupulus]